MIGFSLFTVTRRVRVVSLVVSFFLPTRLSPNNCFSVSIFFSLLLVYKTILLICINLSFFIVKFQFQTKINVKNDSIFLKFIFEGCLPSLHLQGLSVTMHARRSRAGVWKMDASADLAAGVKAVLPVGSNIFSSFSRFICSTDWYFFQIATWTPFAVRLLEKIWKSIVACNF